MKTIQWIILCMVALFTIPTVQAQEIIDENNNTTAVVEEDVQPVNMVYLTTDQLFDAVKKYDKAEFIEIDSFMMGIAKMMAPREEKEFLNKIKTMRIVELNACSKADKERFAEFIKTVELTSYEPGVNEVNDENKNEKMRIYIKVKGETITEMIAASWGGEECNLMQINGKMSVSDIEAVANGAGSSVK